MSDHDATGATGEPTRRDAAKAARRHEILRAAAHLMARRGYAGVRLEDIGAAVGVSGPAMYRHFSGKHDLLAQLLIDVSRRLLAGGREVRAENPDAGRTLTALVDRHVDFAVSEPDLIEVQYRDLASLDTATRHEVRRLQREYVDIWVDVLVADRSMTRRAAQARAHAVFGLINSSPRLPELPVDEARAVLAEMALGALRTSGM